MAVDVPVLCFLLPYMFVTLGIGLYAGRNVSTLKDFVLAGRSLPLIIVTSSMYAMFFGAEATLGAAYEMASTGLSGGVVVDPYGGALCLLLYGCFFAFRLYMTGNLTLSDYYVERFGPKVGVVSALINVLGYIFWTAGQVKGLAIITSRTFGIPADLGGIIGIIIVAIYTFRGGMWAVSITELVEAVVIIACLIAVAVQLGNATDSGWISTYQDLGETMQVDTTGGSAKAWINFIAQWTYIGIGSIPSQDIYERMNSAKTWKIAMAGSCCAAVLYLGVAQIPMFMGLVARKVYGQDAIDASDESIIFDLLDDYVPTSTRVVFYAAHLSAILSTASGTLLAAGILITVNIIRPASQLSDTDTLRISRVVTFFFAIACWGVSLFDESIANFVNVSSVWLMVGNLWPLCFGLFWKGTTSCGAGMAMLGGMLTFSTCFMVALNNPDTIGDGEGWTLHGLDTSVYGNCAAVFCIIFFSIIPQRAQDMIEAVPNFIFNRFAVCSSRKDSIIKVDAPDKSVVVDDDRDYKGVTVADKPEGLSHRLN